jgi:hypothetical protein
MEEKIRKRRESGYQEHISGDKDGHDDEGEAIEGQ